MYWLTLAKNRAPGEMRVTETALQSIFVHVYELWSAFEKCHRSTNLGVNLVLPCIMLTLKQGVERCYELQYPGLMGDETINRKITNRINTMCMRLFDPDGQYARFGKGDGTGKAIALSKQIDMK